LCCKTPFRRQSRWDENDRNARQREGWPPKGQRDKRIAGLGAQVIVVASPSNGKLPYDEKVGRVIESRIKDLGERSDLSPGKSGSLRWATSKRGQVGAHPLRDRSRIIWKTKGVPTVCDKYTIA
jgi:hypothetical protein